LLAAAIAGNHRGDTVGEERTFGTASEQKVIALEDGSALILTVANYYTPDNKSIAAEGVIPTAEVHAEDNTTVTDQEEPGAPLPGRVASPDDPVLKKAIEILQGTAATKKAA
jgi:carboxyl-terminal processing protease